MFPSFDSNRPYIYLRFNNTSRILPLIIYLKKYRKVRTKRRETGDPKTVPRKGYKCITVTEKVHKEIQKKAKETNYTIKDYIEYLLLKEKTDKGGK